MRQKTIWMRYLIIGISLYCILFISSCTTDQGVYEYRADIIYSNETDHVIRYYHYYPPTSQEPASHQGFIFEVLPNSKYEMENEGGLASDGDFIPEIDALGLFDGFQGRGEILLEFDNEKKLIYKEGEGSTTANLVAYNFKEISDDYYKFTYTFTEEDYEKALPIE